MQSSSNEAVVNTDDTSKQAVVFGANEEFIDQRDRKKSWSAIFTIICAGFALISDGYQNSVMTMINLVFGQKYPEVYTATLKTRVSNALLIGEILGQVVIGLTCDYMGRKWAITTTTALIVLGGILATVAHGSTTLGMFWMIIVARGIIGFGAGGEYPASSASASEAANETTRRRGTVFVLVTNFPLSFGGPFALIIFLIVWSAAGGAAHLSTVWRVCFGIGIIWPLSVFYFRFRMATSKMYHKGAMRKKVPYLLTLKYYWPRLIGTCGAWFFYDFITFPNGIFSGTILASLIEDQTDLKKVGEWQLLLGILALPGVFVGAFLCEKIGRKYTMMIGFSGYLVFGLIIGCAYEKLSKIVPLFIIFYGLMNSSGNLGPGDMLGLVSSECYATGVRGTAYGLSAAVGKAGAAIGTQVFTPIQENLGKRWTFIIAAIVGTLGVIVTYFFIPHLRQDDLEEEDAKFEAYLRSQGWEGQIGEDSYIEEVQNKQQSVEADS
ncbi:glycerophosphoinositol transporter 1 [Trichomonascus vanleenenianus]|uniref:Git1p n=1 Tax=Trichomonascus vanleenenianus TaxID=2268995 RepID=UPI003ECB5F51